MFLALPTPPHPTPNSENLVALVWNQEALSS